MDSYDLIISVLALNPHYGRCAEKDGINCEGFLKSILKMHPHHVLSDVGIRPHYIHGDSQLLYDAISQLALNGVLRLWIPGNFSPGISLRCRANISRKESNQVYPIKSWAI